ncbi:MAG: peptidylprolyl isomerase [Rhodocyclaceae bacterium]
MRHALPILLLAASLTAARAAGGPVVELRTSMGTMTVELDARRAPASSANFLRYAKDGFYDGTIFHRVIDGFMIQGGGFEPGMRQKPTRAPIANEAANGLKNARGTIAMARTSDPDSATSQFFINLVDNPALDRPSPDGHGYAVFGRVTRGFEVVQAIAKVPKTRLGPFADVPVTPVVIEAVRIVSE